MNRWLLALAVAFAAFGFASADKIKAEDKKDEKKDEAKGPSGIWTKDLDGGATVKLDFTKKDTVLVIVSIGEAKLTITSDLTVDKDGKYTAKAKKVEKKGDFPVDLKDKYECGFKLKIDGKTAKLSDFTANDHEEEGKGAMEGEYKQADDK